MADEIPPPPPPPPLVGYCYDGSAKAMFRLLTIKLNNAAAVIPYDKCISRNLYEAPPWDLIERDLEYALPETHEWLLDSPRFLAQRNQINRRVGGEEAILYWRRHNTVKTIADFETEEVLGTITHFKLMFIGKEFQAIRTNWYLTEYVAEGNRLHSICKLRLESDQLTDLRKNVLAEQEALEDAVLAKYEELKRVGGVELPEDSPQAEAVADARVRLQAARTAVSNAVYQMRIDNVFNYDRVIGLKREAAAGAIVEQQVVLANVDNQAVAADAEADAGRVLWAQDDLGILANVPLVE